MRAETALDDWHATVTRGQKPARDRGDMGVAAVSIECGCFPKYYVEFSDELASSIGTEFCCECGRLIPCGEELYTVRHWQYGEYGEHVHSAKLPCCEECGDLALSWLELGYCWTPGDLRAEIAELAELRDGR